MYLGINLSHDSSAAVISADGRLELAIGEERISRVKNHWGIPRSALGLLAREEFEINHVVIGSDLNLTKEFALKMIANLETNPSAKLGTTLQNPRPAFRLNQKQRAMTSKELLEEAITNILFEAGRHGQEFKFSWIKHHDSHLGSTLGIVLPKIKTLVISLDGMGDGESGAIGVTTQEGKLMPLARFSSLDSLGMLYSSVTSRYNFTPAKHEGKITGLAAMGSYSGAADVLISFVSVKNGIPHIKNVRGFKRILIDRLLTGTALRKSQITSITDIINLAESQSDNYADLAFAIQNILEKTVLEIASFWKSHTNATALAVSGGVFANVKLNQLLATNLGFESVRIFPNMGDGGISAGGVWSFMNQNKLSIAPNGFKNMYLAPATKSILGVESSIQSEELSEDVLIERVTDDLTDGKIVGMHIGKMEFGPRALGNRTILIDPRDESINRTVNRRLKRTEFMPFAPICREEVGARYFHFEKITDLHPFRFMTMTTDVRNEVKSLIPAVVHTDGTARPQLLSKIDNPLVWKILEKFEERTGIGVLVNTSFNVHEEPINFVLEDSINALKQNAVDVIYTENTRFCKK
jgi:carbamoyltransferase